MNEPARPANVEGLEHVEYQIPLRQNLRTLAGRVTPVDKELLRSYFARIARANACTPRELLQVLQPDPPRYPSQFPTYFGVFMDDAYADQLGKALRCTSDEIYSCLLRQDLIDIHTTVQHPGTLRACVECQRENAAWRRWNGDPLYALCPIHKTLLWDLRPNGKPINQAILIRNRPIDWPEDWARKPSETLADLQDQLVTLRKAAMANELDMQPTKMVYDIAWHYRRILNTTAVGQTNTDERRERALRKTASEGWDELDRIGREPRPAQPKTISRVRLRAEDIAAVLPSAMKAVTAATNGDASYYNRVHDRLFRLSGGRHARMRIPDEGSATIERAA